MQASASVAVNTIWYLSSIFEPPICYFVSLHSTRHVLRVMVNRGGELTAGQISLASGLAWLTAGFAYLCNVRADGPIFPWALLLLPAWTVGMTVYIWRSVRRARASGR